MDFVTWANHIVDICAELSCFGKFSKSNAVERKQVGKEILGPGVCREYSSLQTKKNSRIGNVFVQSIDW